jgi:site-specific recombinase XerD
MRRTDEQMTMQMDLFATAPARRIDVHELLRIFLEESPLRDASPHTRRAYEHGVSILLQWLLARGLTSMREVTPSVVRSWRDELAASGLKIVSQRARFAAVKTFFRVMCERGIVAWDPALHVELPEMPEELREQWREPVIDARSVVEMIENARPGSRDRAVLELLYSSGLRGGELRSLTFEDVDLEASLVYVRRGKGGHSRIVPIGAAAIAALRAYIGARPRAAGEIVFNFSRKTLERIVRRASAVVGRELAPHRLRHACATHLVDSGKPFEHVRLMLGHASAETTRIYVHR